MKTHQFLYLTNGLESDVDFFLDHARRRYRIRPTLPGEPDGAALVRRHANGAFERHFAPRLRLVELNDDEAMARIIFQAFAAVAAKNAAADS